MASATNSAAPSSSQVHPVKNEQQQQQLSILSRSLLYAPLAAYHQTRVPPADYLPSLNSLPKTVTEKALTSFLESTSAHFHLSQQSLHGKNTAARPMSEQEYKDRLLQKGLTLVGGGFYRFASKKRSTRSGRRRKRRKLVKITKSEEEQIPDFVWKDQMQFLDNLNRNWNAYAWSMLWPSDETAASLSSSPSAMTLISKRAKLLSRMIEWVGAKVRLEKNPRCGVSCCPPSWEGCQGILMGETAQTWQVFEMDTDTQQRKGKTRTLSVPKQDSLLTVLLPMLESKSSKNTHSDSSLLPKYFCLVLDERRERTTDKKNT